MYGLGESFKKTKACPDIRPPSEDSRGLTGIHENQRRWAKAKMWEVPGELETKMKVLQMSPMSTE